MKTVYVEYTRVDAGYPVVFQRGTLQEFARAKRRNPETVKVVRDFGHEFRMYSYLDNTYALTWNEAYTLAIHMLTHHFTKISWRED